MYASWVGFRSFTTETAPVDSVSLCRAPKAVATLQGFMNELKREVAAGRRGPWVSRRQVEVSHWGLKPQRAGPQLGVKHLVSGPK